MGMARLEPVPAKTAFLERRPAKQLVRRMRLERRKEHREAGSFSRTDSFGVADFSASGFYIADCRFAIADWLVASANEFEIEPSPIPSRPIGNRESAIGNVSDGIWPA